MPAFDQHFVSVTLLCPLDGGPASVGALDGVAVVGIGGNFSSLQSRFGALSYYLTGSSAFLSIDNRAVMPSGTDAFTVEGWVWISSLANSVNTIANLYQSASKGWRLSALVNGQVRLESRDDIQSIFHPDTIALNTWVHWAVTRDPSGLRCWINGVPSAYLVTSAPYDAEQLYFGAPGWETYSDELKCFFSELRVTQGVCRYDAAFAPPDAPFPTCFALIEGVVTDQDGLAAERTLRCYARDTGSLIDTTTSDAMSGAYALRTLEAGEYQVVALDDAGGDKRNDLIMRVSV